MGQQKKKHRGMTGYRLHVRRFAYAGKQGMRSVKFPIFFADTQSHAQFAQSVISDYRTQVGALDLPHWLVHKNAGTEAYSLLEFWLDSLRAGMIFAPSVASLKVLLSRYSGAEERIDQKVRRGMARRDRAFLDRIRWDVFKKTFLIPEGVRSTSTRDSLKRKIAACFSEDTIKANPRYISKETERIIKGVFGKSYQEQDMFWREAYGVDKCIYKGDKTSEKFSAVLMPDIPFQKNAPPAEVVRAYRTWYEGSALAEEEGDDAVQSLVGLSDNYNAFSNYFNEMFSLLRAGETEVLVRAMTALVPAWKGKRKELEKRLMFLHKAACRLPAKPALCGSWDCYRASLGGKIASWFSNYAHQEARVKETLQAHGDEAGKMIADIKNMAASLEGGREAGLTHRIGDVLPRIAFLREAAERLREGEINEEKLSVYRDLLASVRGDVNRIWQEVYGSINDGGGAKSKIKNEKGAAGVYKKIFGESVRFLPQFVGWAKGERYKKYEQSEVLFERGVAVVERAERVLCSGVSENEVSDEDCRRILDTFLRAYRNARSPRFRQIAEKAFRSIRIDAHKILWEEENDARSFPRRFFVSPYARGRYQAIDVDMPDPTKTLQDILRHTKMRWGSYKTIPEKLDAVEFAKIRLALLVRLHPLERVRFSKKDLNGLGKAEGFVDMFADQNKNGFSGEVLGRFLQTTIFSELRGMLQMMSRESFLVRYAVQIDHSEDKFPLVFVPHHEDKGVCQGNRRAWALVAKGSLKKKKQNRKETIVYVKKGKKLQGGEGEYVPYAVDESTLLFIRSSRYQLQFLDNTIPSSSGKHAQPAWQYFLPEISSYSFIVEEEYQATWKNKKLFLSSKGQPRVFVSIPFNIGVSEKGRGEQWKERKTFLGLDVGEFGVAYAVFDSGSWLISTQGFIYDSALRAIREGVSAGKKRQTIGTFGVPSSYVERVRENAITSLRNKIHDLALRYNAKPIYEDSISNFETGSGRITKIYNSVKRADVYGESDADRAQQELVWGKYPKLAGATIGSRGTSRMCSRCFESPYNYTHERDAREFEIVSVSGEYVDIELAPKICARGFLGRKSQVGDRLSAREAIKAVYNAARPSLESSRVKEALKKDGVPEGHILSYREKRGNSAVFVCPFCNYLSDADVQAAFIIALKRWFKESHNTPSSKKQQKDNEGQQVKEAIRQSKLFADFCRRAVSHIEEYEGIPFSPAL